MSLAPDIGHAGGLKDRAECRGGGGTCFGVCGLDVRDDVLHVLLDVSHILNQTVMSVLPRSCIAGMSDQVSLGGTQLVGKSCEGMRMLFHFIRNGFHHLVGESICLQQILERLDVIR